MSDPSDPAPGFDPSDPATFRALVHRVVDEQLDELEALGTRPVWQPLPATARREIARGLPRQGIGEEAAYELFREHVFPYTNGNRHGRFFGWVQGNGSPLAMLSEFLAAGMNPHCAGFDQASTVMELEVVAWLREIMGFPEGTTGVLLSGGTMASFVGLVCARDRALGPEGWTRGLAAASGRLVFYASEETHGWVPKAANVLGLGSESWRRVACDQRGRIRVDALAEMIAGDRRAGQLPFAVIGNAGTVSTGAFDDLEALAELSAREELWFHVDGAFGAWASLSSRAELVRGMERADSLAFDLHKWGYLPFEVACVLVRDGAAHRRPFAIAGDYIPPSQRGVLAAGLPFADLGIELTRSFRALKVWMQFQAYGLARLEGAIEENIAQAKLLEELITADPELETLTGVELNIVCFRYRPRSGAEGDLDALNEELLYRLQESGLFVPSSTRVRGRFGIRVAITNHRTRRRDLTLLVETLGRLGREIVQEACSAGEGE